jgi:hypothetical protein
MRPFGRTAAIFAVIITIVACAFGVRRAMDEWRMREQGHSRAPIAGSYSTSPSDQGKIEGSAATDQLRNSSNQR